MGQKQLHSITNWNSNHKHCKYTQRSPSSLALGLGDGHHMAELAGSMETDQGASVERWKDNHGKMESNSQSSILCHVHISHSTSISQTLRLISIAQSTRRVDLLHKEKTIGKHHISYTANAPYTHSLHLHTLITWREKIVWNWSYPHQSQPKSKFQESPKQLWWWNCIHQIEKK